MSRKPRAVVVYSFPFPPLDTHVGHRGVYGRGGGSREIGVRRALPRPEREREREWSFVHRYTLVGHEPVLATDRDAWRRWMVPENVRARRVGEVTFAAGSGWTETRVSTLFLGVDQNPGLDPEDETPRLFETRVFGGPLHRRAAWSATWDEAVAQHARMVERVKKLLAVL